MEASENEFVARVGADGRFTYVDPRLVITSFFQLFWLYVTKGSLGLRLGWLGWLVGDDGLHLSKVE